MTDEVSLGRALQFWRRWWGTIVGNALVIGGLVAAIVFAWPRHFSSHFSVFVTGMTNMAASAQVQMQLASLFGLSTGGIEYVTAVLESDEIQLQVIEKLGLRSDKNFWWGSLENSRTPDRTLAQLRRVMKIKGPVPPMQGEIRLTINTISPELSYKIATELLALLNVRMEAETKNRSVFLEEQLKNSQVELDKSELALRDFAERESIAVPLEEQGKEEFKAQVQLQTQRILAEVELKALRGRLNAPGDVKVQMMIQSEIAGLEARIAELDDTMDARMVEFKKLPKKAKRYVDLLRDVKSREKIFEVYLEHAELARLYDVGKMETRPFRVVDTPYLPQYPVKRHGLIKCIAGFLLGAVVGLLWSLFQEVLALARTEAALLPPLPSQALAKPESQDPHSQL